MTILDFCILKEGEEEQAIIHSGHGRFKEVPFKAALELTGMQLYSNRKGDYVLSYKPATPDWVQIQSCPKTMKFQYNRLTKRLRASNFGLVQCSVKTVK